MRQLIYKSDTTVTFSNAEISRLLMKARAQNDIHEVTGILVRHGNSFLQVLEGPVEVVDDLFNRIASDPRHKSIQVLRRAEIEERDFADWSMAFVYTDNQLCDLPSGLDAFFNSKGGFAKNAGEQAVPLLKQFRYTPWRRRVDLGYTPLIVRPTPHYLSNRDFGYLAAAQ
ncbi:BLUF domain-containing protein [Planctomicrobium sp. SH527]|uniref:BLUF domain-containing protein n=1 Tax=Planctomicrobium sp. SH527 TaxID=3448123 RepID=UPI003F5C755C